MKQLTDQQKVKRLLNAMEKLCKACFTWNYEMKAPEKKQLYDAINVLNKMKR